MRKLGGIYSAIPAIGACLIATFVAACGGSEEGTTTSSTSAAVASADVCGWLSDAEIAEWLGAAPSSSAPAAGLPGCMWSAASGLPLLQVTLAPNGATSAAQYRDRMAEQLGEAWSDTDLAPVAGLGDWAFYTAEARMLQVFRGRRVLQIIVSRPAAEREATAIARVLLVRDW